MRVAVKQIQHASAEFSSNLSIFRDTPTVIKADGNITVTVYSYHGDTPINKMFTLIANQPENKGIHVIHDDGSILENLGYVTGCASLYIDENAKPTLLNDRDIKNNITTSMVQNQLTGGGRVVHEYDYTASIWKLSWSSRLIAIPAPTGLARHNTASISYIQIAAHNGVDLGSSRSWKVVYARITDKQLNRDTSAITITNAEVQVDYYTTYKHHPLNIIIMTITGDDGGIATMGNGVEVDDFGSNARINHVVRNARRAYAGARAASYDEDTRLLSIDRAIWIPATPNGYRSPSYVDCTLVDFHLGTGGLWKVIYADIPNNVLFGGSAFHITNANVQVVTYNLYVPRNSHIIVAITNADSGDCILGGTESIGKTYQHIQDDARHLTGEQTALINQINQDPTVLPRHTMLDPGNWSPTPFGTPTAQFPEGWQTLNGLTTENAIIEETDPLKLIDPDRNTSELHWLGKATAIGGSCGGYTSPKVPIDKTKTYRLVQYIRNDGLLANSARCYLGIYGYNASNANLGIQYLSSGTNSTNYYFWSGDLPIMDKWYAMVGYIHAESTPLDPVLSNHLSGIYEVGDGTMTKVPGIGTPVDGKWNTSLATTQLSLRVYQFYATAINDQKRFLAPSIEVVDGTEFPMEDILLLPRLHTLSTSTPKEGAIKYNPATQKHQGFDGTVWNDLY